MEVEFASRSLYDIYTLWISAKYPKDVVIGFIKKVRILVRVSSEFDLNSVRSLHFEKLSNYALWNYSIRINRKRRIIFNILWKEVISITEISNHYS